MWVEDEQGKPYLVQYDFKTKFMPYIDLLKEDLTLNGSDEQNNEMKRKLKRIGRENLSLSEIIEVGENIKKAIPSKKRKFDLPWEAGLLPL